MMDFISFTFINYFGTVFSAIQLYPEAKPTSDLLIDVRRIKKNSGISQNIFVSYRINLCSYILLYGNCCLVRVHF